MKNKTLIILFLVISSMTVRAQWRIGVTGGTAYNVFSMNKEYLTDYTINGRWGVTLGISGQYNFYNWFGVRADLNWTQKNYRVHRVAISQMDHRYRNDYLQLPLMASFSFGGQRLRGFCNLGFYGGYWLSSHRHGTDYNKHSDYTYGFSEKVEFNSEKDKRWDCGLIGGIGLEYRIAPHWALQAELRYYYSTTSTTKQYMRVKDYRYNATTALQLGASYVF